MKTQYTLYIFERLISSPEAMNNIKFFSLSLNISSLQVKRYIQELKAFICNYSEEYIDLIYDRRLKSYKLIKA